LGKSEPKNESKLIYGTNRGKNFLEHDRHIQQLSLFSLFKIFFNVKGREGRAKAHLFFGIFKKREYVGSNALLGKTNPRFGNTSLRYKPLSGCML